MAEVPGTSFYADSSSQALGAAFFEFVVGGAVRHRHTAWTFINDEPGGGADLVGSYDGSTTHFRVKPGEAAGFDKRARDRVWLRSSTGAAMTYRFWSWQADIRSEI